MAEAMKNKRNQKRNNVNINKGIFNSIIRFILVILILSKLNENRIIQSGLYSIIAKFQKSSSNSQRILNCGKGSCNNILTFPEKIRINNGTKENYIYNNSFSLTEEINIIEYFWEDVSITNCSLMFYDCVNIIEIDFSYFNTSNVTSTRSMFAFCGKLVSLNLSNFDTSKVTNMFGMFFCCGRLISLDLSSFDTSHVSIISRMFYCCHSLISLDLSNFDTSQAFGILEISSYLGGMKEMFFNCYSLTSLNLFKFNISHKVKIDNMFSQCKNLSYINFGKAIIENEAIISELNKAYSPNLYILINNETLTYLNSLNVRFKFSYEIFIPQIEINFNRTTFLEIYSTYYTTNSEIDLINNSFTLNLLNSINIEEKIYTTNFLAQSITNNLENINTSSSLLKDSTNHIKKSESNLIINSNSIKVLNNYSKINNKSELIQNIREDLINGKINLKNNESFYYEFEEENIIIEITNTEKERNKEKNKTSINLGNCEYVLKNEYNISNNSYLYFFKTDIKHIGYKIPIINYEIYFPFNENNLTKLDLNFCKNEKIEVSIPVSIEEDINKYNSSSDYYNDICSTTTSKSGTDISIKDRRNEYIDNNMTLCEEGCKLIDYDYETENAKWSWDIKINIPFLSDDININKDYLLKSFIDITNIANFNLMKCYNIVLYIYNLKNNHGFYIILSIMSIYLICLILFYAKYYLLLKTKVNSIVNDVSNSTIKLNEVVPDKINNNDSNKSINKNINNIVGEIKIDSKKNMINKGIDKILKKISKKKKRIKKKKFKSKKKDK